MAKWLPKPISKDDVQYWWRVLEGKKLVKLKDYKFDAKVRLCWVVFRKQNSAAHQATEQVAMFTEETLPQPIRVLNDNEVVPEGREAQRLVEYPDPRLMTEVMERYTLWVDENRVCVGLEAG